MSIFLFLQFKTTQDCKALPEAEDSNVKSACNGEEVNLRFQETFAKCSGNCKWTYSNIAWYHDATLCNLIFCSVNY